jgi:hypothetical protein
MTPADLSAPSGTRAARAVKMATGWKLPPTCPARSRSGGVGAELDAALAGHGCLVLITGDAGIGKTAAAARFAGQAAACGVVVVVAWGFRAECDGAPVFWPWTQVLRAARPRRGPRRPP